MERLKSACLLALIALATPLASAQQTTHTGKSSGSVAIIGDVEKYGNLAIPEGKALSVEQAVREAVPLSESVQVKVIRNGRDQVQWTQPLSTTSRDNGEPVMDGDVLVVQAMSPLTATSKPNAALRTDASVLILALTQDGITIGDVLMQTNNYPLADGRLKVLSRFHGTQPLSRAELHLPVKHGDVISISSGNQTVLKGFGNMSPSFSEWKGSTAGRNRDPFAVSHVSVDSAVGGNTENEPQPIRFPPFPTFPTEGAPSNETATTLHSEAISTDAPAIRDNAPALPISQSDDLTDLPTSGSKISFASESTTIAPAPPMEIPIAGETKTSSAVNPWNLVFIGGLLLAGTLILAGTMKPDTTDETFAADIAPQRAATTNPGVPNPAAQFTRPATLLTESPPQASTIAESWPVVSEPVVAEPVVAEPVFAEPEIAAQEWFSSDWRKPSAEEDSPPAVETETEVEQEAETSAESVARTSNDSAELDVLQDVLNTDCIAMEIAADTTETTDSVSMNPEESPQEEELVQTRPTKDFSDLEDLLQNRLPIDLCETQLPMRVSLFGRPTGPQRLRIDAAHETIPAPHMHLSADKNRAVPVAATSTPVPQTPIPADESGGLDRALHFLQERTNS